MIISEVGVNKYNSKRQYMTIKKTVSQAHQDSCIVELTMIVITCRNTQTQVLTVKNNKNKLNYIREFNNIVGSHNDKNYVHCFLSLQNVHSFLLSVINHTVLSNNPFVHCEDISFSLV